MNVYCYRTMRGARLLMPCKGHAEPILVPPDKQPAQLAKELGHTLMYQIGTPLQKHARSVRRK